MRGCRELGWTPHLGSRCPRHGKGGQRAGVAAAGRGGGERGAGARRILADGQEVGPAQLELLQAGGVARPLQGDGCEDPQEGWLPVRPVEDLHKGDGAMGAGQASGPRDSSWRLRPSSCHLLAELGDRVRL